MVKDLIEQQLVKAGHSAQSKGLLPSFALPETPVQRTANSAHGDYASSLPLKLARSARMKPLDIAKALVTELPDSDLFARVEIAPPGFINFTLNPDWLARQVGAIIAAGPSFGEVEIGHGQTVQVEFVSANPTGPLTAASGRGGALGDALANILNAAGYRASREYYLNDAGSRMDAFNQSLYARYNQALGHEMPVPKDGYHGTYMLDFAQSIVGESGDKYLKMDQAEAAVELGRIGLARIIESIKGTIDLLGVKYDAWFSEQSLHDRGVIAEILKRLTDAGYVEEREGAVWFVSTAVGEEKDNVLVRSSGVPTYFASDIAYHYNKFVERGLDQVIDIWGADHQGHVRRMHAGINALGIPQDKLRILIHQMITLKRGDEIVKISKRTGDIVTLREVLEEVGADACRFFFLSRSADAHMDFDLDLATKQSNDNPVYYVQYAHARIASILRYAGDVDLSDSDLSLLKHETEQALIRKMLELPELVEMMAENLEPHHLPHYAQDLAGTFHQFYTQCRVVTEDEALTKSRLMLVRAARIALANALALMGISAPEQM